MNMSKSRPIGLALLACAAGVASGGCVSRVAKADYPESWSPAKETPAAQCPRIAGRYVNSGEAASGPKAFFCGTHYKYRGTWCGETALSQNVGGVASGDWVELRQPDDDTLVVVSSDPTVAVQELHHKNGDFTCSGGALERRVHANVASVGDNSNKPGAARDTFNAISSAGMAMMYASGGVRTLIRSFKQASDGSLVMTVTQAERGAVLLIPYHESNETFVRWKPAASAPEGPAPAPSAAVAAAAPDDLPSNHVGIFEATNGALWSKVKVTNLDGSHLNTDARLPGEPIAMQPGWHWVQVAAGTTHMIPLRDINTRYAFEIEAAPGHRYRIPKKPTSCLAPGDVDAALGSSNVYHTRLSVIDQAPGASPRSVDVEALCVSASNAMCSPADPASDAAADPEPCVALAGWSRGYSGHDAGLAPPQ